MYSLLVLGLIPGTNIQIGFWAWIILTAILMITFALYKQHLVRLIKRWWHQFDEDAGSLARRPLHASQLHRRLHQLAR
jgi:hypothetical protein